MIDKEDIDKATKHLIRVSTVAREIKVSPKYVYDLIKKSKIDAIEIDGVKFVIMNELYHEILENAKKK